MQYISIRSISTVNFSVPNLVYGTFSELWQSPKKYSEEGYINQVGRFGRRETRLIMAGWTGGEMQTECHYLRRT